MLTKPTSKAAGFTITETLIVLAVAGLILVIVFAAIPALTRNSRNNQRKQNIQSILAAISHYELNNSANFPTTAELQPLLDQYAHLSYYDTSNVTAQPKPAVGGGPVPILNPNDNPGGLEAVDVYNHAKCDSNSPGNATTGGAGYSDVVALYALETGNGQSPQCQQL